MARVEHDVIRLDRFGVEILELIVVSFELDVVVFDLTELVVEVGVTHYQVVALDREGCFLLLADFESVLLQVSHLLQVVCVEDILVEKIILQIDQGEEVGDDLLDLVLSLAGQVSLRVVHVQVILVAVANHHIQTVDFRVCIVSPEKDLLILLQAKDESILNEVPRVFEVLLAADF